MMDQFIELLQESFKTFSFAIGDVGAAEYR